MKKEKYIFIGFVATYSLLLLVLWAKILYSALRTQRAAGQSNIPEYSVASIKKANQVLEAREQIDTAQKPNINDYRFGLPEPFK
jgi:hypothetical protein